tara:strand:+ start:528 stop:707 length:180 start_codon:yes stop_codon:yes gene_type:complete
LEEKEKKLVSNVVLKLKGAIKKKLNRKQENEKKKKNNRKHIHNNHRILVLHFVLIKTIF